MTERSPAFQPLFNQDAPPTKDAPAHGSGGEDILKSPLKRITYIRIPVHDYDYIFHFIISDSNILDDGVKAKGDAAKDKQRWKYRKEESRGYIKTMDQIEECQPKRRNYSNQRKEKMLRRMKHGSAAGVDKKENAECRV